ncbi:hypothetical protein K0M31_018567 [Melipona bicolor]|uniref:Uncharacterized protein n=1 Tax=Melipona bicolor TaxID=60889 RepID=A0AA40KRS5_9HYME|nr:hypothetical protein K0M31_018567 [Melipona bicolor]
MQWDVFRLEKCKSLSVTVIGDNCNLIAVANVPLQLSDNLLAQATILRALDISHVPFPRISSTHIPSTLNFAQSMVSVDLKQDPKKLKRRVKRIESDEDKNKDNGDGFKRKQNWIHVTERVSIEGENSTGSCAREAGESDTHVKKEKGTA